MKTSAAEAADKGARPRKRRGAVGSAGELPPFGPFSAGAAIPAGAVGRRRPPQAGLGPRPPSGWRWSRGGWKGPCVLRELLVQACPWCVGNGRAAPG